MKREARSMKNEMERVVITGMGVVSPIGIGREDFFRGLEKGRDGIIPITLFDVSNQPFKWAGEISSFNVKEYLPQKGLKFLSRTAQFACTATDLAMKDMNRDLSSFDPGRMGVVLGTTYGNVNSLLLFDEEAFNAGVQFADPSLFPNTVVNSPAGNIAILFGFSGMNATLSTGNSSSLDAIQFGIRSLLREETDIVFAGGVEELSSFVHFGFLKGGHLSSSWDGNRRGPFDRKRDGFFLGEGGCILALERLDHAILRNASLYAEIEGFGSSYGNDLTAPVEAMMRALSSSQLDPEEVDLIYASGNGSIPGDRKEGIAIGEVFGKRSKEIPVTAIKSMIGECCGASGAFQVAQAALSLLHQTIPPTLYLEEIDPDLPIQNIVTEGRGVLPYAPTAMINAFNEKGNHSTMIITSCQ